MLSPVRARLSTVLCTAVRGPRPNRALSRSAREGRARAAHAVAGGKGHASDEKRKILEDAIGRMNKSYGQNAVMFLTGARSQVETVPSGVLTLDMALGGGLPKGRVIEVFGPESSGKTTLALQAIAEVQKRGGLAALVDVEHAVDPVYAAKLGVNLDDLVLSQPEHGEGALNIVDELARTGVVDLIAVDSVSALIPKAELEGEVGATQVGGQARLMSSSLRRLSKNANMFGCTIIFINQLRQKIGVMYGNPETTSGGQALKYYSSVRIDVRRREILKEGDKNTGIRVRTRVVKNKCAPPLRDAEFDIRFDSGIDTVGCVIDAAETSGLVKRRGAYYYFEDAMLGQGRAKTVDFLKSNPEVLGRMEALVLEKLHAGFTPPIDTAEDDALAVAEEAGAVDGEAEAEPEVDITLTLGEEDKPEE
ncbi:unnamed protein product [Pedinophyceae sp. YPF-701]|nr:unnamed protein product [Pedinophyceae sp. YPF-701]